VCRPFLFALFFEATRAQGCTMTGFFMIAPSLWRRATFLQELATLHCCFIKRDAWHNTFFPVKNCARQKPRDFLPTIECHIVYPLPNQATSVNNPQSICNVRASSAREEPFQILGDYFSTRWRSYECILWLWEFCIIIFLSAHTTSFNRFELTVFILQELGRAAPSMA